MIFFDFFSHVAPIKLYGAGNYLLGGIKEIKTTDSFYNLGEGTTHCQRRESREDCESRLYMDNLLTNCHCLPFWLIDFTAEQVLHKNTRSVSKCVSDP